MKVLDNSGSTTRESAEFIRSGSFTRVRAREKNPNLSQDDDEFVYGHIDCPDCEPFRGSIIITLQGPVPFLSLNNLEMVRKLQSFLHLAQDWDSYGSDKPSEKAINDAISFVRQLDECGINVYFVAPGPNGEILVELEKHGKSAEIYFYKDKLAEFIFFPQDQAKSESVLPDVHTFLNNQWRPFLK